jgi:Protein of unknown function (DUF2827)
MNCLPGNTILPEEEATDSSTLFPLVSPVSSISSTSSTLLVPCLVPCAVKAYPESLTAHTRPVIILGSNDVNDTTLFLNGLTQNIVILYDLFESLGYTCYLLQNGPSSEKREFIKRYRTVTAQDMVTYAMRIRIFVEIGMSLDPTTRQYLRSTGAKIAKLYLGNILNIDVETVQYYPSMFFYHHIVGEIDQIWTSPHYRQHLEYAAVLNRTPLDTARAVPYVWDPCFLTRYLSPHELEWVPPADWKTQDLVVMDPSISFQKCSFYSLLLAEAFARRHPEWKGSLHVINGDRLQISSHARNHVLPSLRLFQQGRIRLYGRKKIHDILREHRSACFLTHQWNNDYNYMTLELMYCQFPILHNSEGWKDYGYSYSIDAWDKAIDTLFTALTQHSEQQAVYRSHAHQLLWRHSIHNPSLRQRWQSILEGM